MFKHLHIELSSKCNLKCSYCRVKNKKGHLLTSDDFLLVCDKLGELTDSLEEVHFCGNGEPLMNPHIIDILRESRKRFPLSKIKITTNLSIEIDNIIDDLIRFCDSISVSIDAFSDNNYNKIRRQGNFNLVIKNIELINKLKSTTESSIDLNLNFTTNEYNIDEICHLEDFCLTYGLNSALVWRVSDLKSKLYSKKNQKKWFSNLNKIKNSHKIILKYTAIPDYSEAKSKICLAPFEWLNITSNLFISPCCEIWDEETLKNLKLPQISLQSFNIKSLWNSLGMKKFRDDLLNGKSRFCANCHWNYFQFTSNLV